MIPTNAIQHVKDLHARYVARTGYDIALNMARENDWRNWCQWGNWAWTPDDLSLVIGYLRAQIRNDKRNNGALKFSNLIGMPDKFEEDLQLAREAASQVFAGRPRRPAPQAPAPAEPEPEETPQERARRWRESVQS